MVEIRDAQQATGVSCRISDDEGAASAFEWHGERWRE